MGAGMLQDKHQSLNADDFQKLGTVGASRNDVKQPGPLSQLHRTTAVPAVVAQRRRDRRTLLVTRRGCTAALARREFRRWASYFLIHLASDHRWEPLPVEDGVRGG